MSGERFDVTAEVPGLVLDVPAHGVRVLLFGEPNNNVELAVELARLHGKAGRPVPDMTREQ